MKLEEKNETGPTRILDERADDERVENEGLPRPPRTGQASVRHLLQGSGLRAQGSGTIPRVLLTVAAWPPEAPQGRVAWDLGSEMSPSSISHRPRLAQI